MSKRKYSIRPVSGHTMLDEVVFSGQEEFDDWFNKNHNKIANWCALQYDRAAKTLLVFFHDDKDALALAKLKPAV